VSGHAAGASERTRKLLKHARLPLRLRDLRERLDGRRLRPERDAGHLERHALEEGPDDERVERLAGLGTDDVRGLVERHRPVVRTRGDERLEVVRHREHTGAERDRLAAEAERITLAVPPLVMRPDDRRDILAEILDERRANGRMAADALELLRRERARLRQDPRGDDQLADVVHDGRKVERLAVWRWEVKSRGQRGDACADLRNVVRPYGVARVNRYREGLY
jgi:hypothetical protein